jgi:Tfp pilus assembly protein PilF
MTAIRLIKAAAIVAAGIALYSATLHGDWMMDDDILVTNNLAVKSGSWGRLGMIWLDPQGVDYFPLTYSAFWALWQAFGKETTGYHAVTILLHVTSGLLLWWLLARMTIPGAWAAAFLFTIHPVCVESVAWIAELKNTLSLPLFLAACLCWVMQDDAAEGRRQKGLYTLSLLFFLLAMLAKPSVVAFPVVTLLHAWWKRGRIDSRDMVHAVPFFLVSLALGLVTISFQHGRAIGGEPLPIGGLDSRLALAGLAILFYLATIVWPVNLLPVYPVWPIVPPAAWMFLAWPVIGGAAWWMWRHRTTWGRHALFACGFFLLMVGPVLGLIDISYMRLTWVADHFLYVPMIGPIVLLAAAGTTWVNGLDAGPRRAALGAATVMAASLAAGTYLYAREWVNEDRLWAYTLAHNPDAWIARLRVGVRLMGRDKVDSAIEHFRHAARLRPELAETKNNLGTALIKQGRADEAIAVLEEALLVAHPLVETRRSLAEAYCQAGRFAEARDLAAELLQQDSTNLGLLTTHGLALAALGERERALEELERALALDPDHKPARDARERIQRESE